MKQSGRNIGRQCSIIVGSGTYAHGKYLFSQRTSDDFDRSDIDAMPIKIAKNLVQTLLQKGKNPSTSKVLVMGITFKEDVADIRNSKVVDLVKELMSYSIHVQITDPWASPNEVAHEYKLSLTEQVGSGYDAIVLAIGHDEYKNLGMDYFRSIAQGELILFDLKGLYQGQRNDVDFYWSL